MFRIPSLILLLLASLAAADAEPGRIIVTGSARVLVVPDEVVVVLAAEAFEKDLALAKTATDGGIAAVRAAARELGVKEAQVQTDAIDIRVSWERPDSRVAFGPENRYFKVRRGITVVLSEVAQLDPLLSKALAGGITSVDGITFRSTRLREHRDAARLQAAKAAREKAEAMAGALGSRVGRTVCITERDNRWSWCGWNGNRQGFAQQNCQVQMDGGGAVEGGDEGIAPGRIAIDATIDVQFALAE